MLFVHGMSDSEGAVVEAKLVLDQLKNSITEINSDVSSDRQLSISYRSINHAELVTECADKMWLSTWDKFPLTLLTARKYVQTVCRNHNLKIKILKLIMCRGFQS